MEPSPKSRALPRNLAHGFHPRIRAPFQVSLLENPEASAAVAACSSVPPVLHSAGLPCPERIRRSSPSVQLDVHVCAQSEKLQNCREVSCQSCGCKLIQESGGMFIRILTHLHLLDDCGQADQSCAYIARKSPLETEMRSAPASVQ